MKVNTLQTVHSWELMLSKKYPCSKHKSLAWPLVQKWMMAVLTAGHRLLQTHCYVSTLQHVQIVCQNNYFLYTGKNYVYSVYLLFQLYLDICRYAGEMAPNIPQFLCILDMMKLLRYWFSCVLWQILLWDILHGSR